MVITNGIRNGGEVMSLPFLAAIKFHERHERGVVVFVVLGGQRGLGVEMGHTSVVIQKLRGVKTVRVGIGRLGKRSNA